jgi:hypothetical protein
MPIQRVLRAMLPSACLAGLLGGCATESATFEGRPRDQVWTAMVAVAEQPEYADWRMLDNLVAVDPEQEKIVVYRALRRVAVRPGADKVRQDREYQFEISLEPENPKQPDAPAKVVFATLQPIMPSRLTDEAERYFASVAELLGEVKETPQPKPLATEPPRDVRE